jgi:hypothetical protein
MWGAKGPLADNWLIDNQGYLQKDVDAASLDGTMTINISQGTKILDSAGNPLANITAALIDPPATAPDGYKILKSLDFTPNGAKFDPGITITISFNQSDVPAGKTVALACYNETSSGWEFVSGHDNGDGTATFVLSHFSTYSLMSGTAEKTSTTTTTISPWIWILIGVGALLVLLLAILLARRFQTAKA